MEGENEQSRSRAMRLWNHSLSSLWLTPNFLFTETKSIWKRPALLLQNDLPPVKNKKQLQRVYLADSSILHLEAARLLAVNTTKAKRRLSRDALLRHGRQDISVRSLSAAVPAWWVRTNCCRCLNGFKGLRVADREVAGSLTPPASSSGTPLFCLDLSASEAVWGGQTFSEKD